MPRESVKEVLIRRDGMDSFDADDLIHQFQDELDSLLLDGGAVEDAYQLVLDWFGLAPDYLDDFFP